MSRTLEADNMILGELGGNFWEVSSPSCFRGKFLDGSILDRLPTSLYEGSAPVLLAINTKSDRKYQGHLDGHERSKRTLYVFAVRLVGL